MIAAGGAVLWQRCSRPFEIRVPAVCRWAVVFAASEESNAAPALKEFYLKMTKEDIVQIDSPVGYKGRAIRNPFAQLSLDNKAPKPTVCDACLKHCTHSFCIIRALTRAQQGDVEHGLVFTGANMWKIKEILPVKEIFRRMKKRRYCKNLIMR